MTNTLFLIESLIRRLDSEEGCKLEQEPPVKDEELLEFEKEHNVSLPALLKEFYKISNGLYDGCLFEMLQLKDLQNLLLFVKGSEERIRILSDGGTKNLTLKKDEYLINYSESYYHFADYNFGGGHWFINLDKNASKYGEIILLYSHLNKYCECVESIEEFFAEIIGNEIEHLLR
ncbi:SMI1/KNR4 family protein [Flammeovirga sp. EKP202]|uniref:SMI1/KNR4 family protein n=1 Tax=Flammeovirga sp. EKP202 TaxID=2770592 RepID=UPI00165F292E|nr:SMI1/KNR4 family protein [Flammeovirga sp. EKP202]MBD0404523.1 SMI1/KNR4 family protein [Flammeovirga sp. EKP202]